VLYLQNFDKRMFKILKKIFTQKLEDKSISVSKDITRETIQSYNRGIKLFENRQYKEALSRFDLAIESGLYNEAYLDRGICLQRLDFHLDAIDDFTKAIEMFPLDANNYFLRSLSEKAIGEFDSAIADNKKAIELSKIDSVENLERDEKSKKLDYDSSTIFYKVQLEMLFQQTNFSKLIKMSIIKPKIRRK
jgi:tetratricopeptide (TPR) repeat protein